MMHKHVENRHLKRDYDEEGEISKHKRKKEINSDDEDEGYQERSSKDVKKHKKKRKEIGSDDEVKYEKTKKHKYEKLNEPDQTHKTHESNHYNKREVITVNDNSLKNGKYGNQREESDAEKNSDRKRKKKRNKKYSSDSSESENHRIKYKSSRKDRNLKDNNSDSEGIEKRKKKTCKDRQAKENSSDSEDNDKRNKRPGNVKMNDSSSENEKKKKYNKRQRSVRENSANSGDESVRKERKQKKGKTITNDSENESKVQGRRMSKKHKKENRDDLEDRQYHSREKDKRRKKEDKRRGREDNSHDSDLDHISRPVGSRYYEVSRPYDEDEVTYKESQVQVGSRYYGGGERDRRENTKNSDIQSSTDKKKTEVKPDAPKTSTNILSSKTGGAYIPPAKLKLMQQSISDKSSIEYQRISWEALKKSIHGSVNKVNTGNIGIIARKLFQENIIRGRGLLTRTILQAQAASPTFTNVYAALVDIINSKFPSIAELLLNRCIQQFKRCFKRNDKALCINSVTFIAHLVNQQVAHEIIVLEILTLLVETPTNDSIEVACALLKECGKKLTELSSKGVTAIFSMLLNILHEGKLEKRVQYMIEVLAQVRKDNFKDFPDVTEDLDLVPEEDKFTHLMTLDGVKDTQDILNVFQYDPEYLQNEEKYLTLRSEILGDDEEDEDGDDEDDDDEEEDDEEGEKEKTEGGEGTIIDNTETNLVALRRIIYLTIHSSLDFEECAHKLLRMQLKPGQESELCHMFLDCCAEQRTYEKFFGLLAQRFCEINRMYVGPLEAIFRDSYSTVHRLDINKLRNVAKFFAHQLFTDAIGWHVLSCIRLNEEETTSSGRIFIKILFQELSEYMGLSKLNQKIKDPLLAPAMEGVFPRDNPKNTRFAINFFTSIGLGGLTDELREHLKSQPKAPLMLQNLSSPSSSSSSSSSTSSSSSSSDSSSSEDEREKRKRKKKKRKKKT